MNKRTIHVLYDAYNTSIQIQLLIGHFYRFTQIWNVTVQGLKGSQLGAFCP